MSSLWLLILLALPAALCVDVEDADLETLLAAIAKLQSVVQSSLSKSDHLDFDHTVRKKDAPSNDIETLMHLRTQSQQVALVSKQGIPGKTQTILVNDTITEKRSWIVPCIASVGEASGYPYYPIAGCSPHTCQRVVEDGVATPEEASALLHATQSAMIGLFHQGGSTSLAPDSEASAERLGTAGRNLFRVLKERVRERITLSFGVNSTLFDSGSLLTRLKADYQNDIYEMSPGHVYWNAHVDKANIPSYDYSALLYLNTQNIDFEGGSFAFLDKEEDNLVIPRAGRLLMFTSSFENLHQVREVTKGTRYVLALWFTCSESFKYQDSDD